MASHGGTTTDHDEIRRWAEERGAQPSRVARTGRDDAEQDPGIIRLDFPGYSGGGALEPITWDEWFRAFDENGLAFVHHDTTAGGEHSNFNRLVRRETAAARAEGDSHANARTTGASRRGARPATAKGAAKRSTVGGRESAAKGGGRGAASAAPRRPAKAGAKGAAKSGAKAAAKRGATKSAGTSAGKRARTSAGGRAGPTAAKRPANAAKKTAANTAAKRPAAKRSTPRRGR